MIQYCQYCAVARTTRSSSNSLKSDSILSLLGKVFGSHFVLGILLKLFHSALNFSGPLTLKWELIFILNSWFHFVPLCHNNFSCFTYRLILSFIGNENEYLWHGYVYSVLLLVVGFLQILIWHWYLNLMLCVGLQMRNGILSLLYRKVRNYQIEKHF